jgi:hypothetical protein
MLESQSQDDRQGQKVNLSPIFSGAKTAHLSILSTSTTFRKPGPPSFLPAFSYALRSLNRGDPKNDPLEEP